MSRQEFSAQVKREAAERSGGRCECHRMSEDIAHLFPAFCDRVAEEFDHILADCLGGDNSLDNCAHLCKVHHKIKTATDQKYRAKRNKHRVDRERRDRKRANPKPKAKIKSPGFSKTHKRTFSGEVKPK